MLVGESLSRRHSGTIPGETMPGRPLAFCDRVLVGAAPSLSGPICPRHRQISRSLLLGTNVTSRRGLAFELARWPSRYISPHPRSPGVTWVWHDAPLRVFLLQRTGTLHTLYLFQKYDIATACYAAMTEGTAILHHPCDRTRQIPIWPRCRGRSE